MLAMASSVLPNCKLKTFSLNAFLTRTRRFSTSVPFLPLGHRRSVIAIVCSAGSDGGAVDAGSELETDTNGSDPCNSGDAYVGLFIRMLGIDKAPLDREEAVKALWKYSQGGKHCIDAIMKFRGCVNLTTNLLKSDSNNACEAAAGLLRTISSVNSYVDLVAESGVIEEISSLLTRPSITAEVKEQSICILWSLSVSEKHRRKIANLDLLLVLVKFLDDEEIKVKEAAGGVLANLALSSSNHGIMVDAGLIQKLAEFLRNNMEDSSKIIRKEAKNILLELAKDEYYRLLIVEEGLVLVPLVGTDAYKSFRPAVHAWPTLPDGTELERCSSNPSSPSRFGASDLLLGLNIQDKNASLDEATTNAIVGRTHQQFLARLGAIELEEGKKPQVDSHLHRQFTLLPWMDGIARLVLILGLEDESAIEIAAESIANAAINEHMRTSFKEAGAVKSLVRLLSHRNESITFAAAHALERLSISYEVCKSMEAEGVVDPMVKKLKNRYAPASLLEKAINVLGRVFDPNNVIQTKLYDGPINGINGSEKALDGMSRRFIGVKGLTTTPDDFSELKHKTRESVFDSSAVSCLIEVLKSSHASLQTKAASILEYLSNFEELAENIMSAGILSGIQTVFQQNLIYGMDESVDEVNPLEAEEAGLAISAASRLLVKLLDSGRFCDALDATHFIHLLRKWLKYDIPLDAKEWVAACLIKLESFRGSHLEPDNPINKEVTLYETIPRLVEQLETSFSSEEQEAAVVELNKIISRGAVEYTKAVAAQGAIFPLVKLIEEGSRQAAEASLAILYNLSMDNENHPAIIASGAVPVLRRIVIAEAPQWRRALQLLRALPI